MTEDLHFFLKLEYLEKYQSTKNFDNVRIHHVILVTTSRKEIDKEVMCYCEHCDKTEILSTV